LPTAAQKVTLGQDTASSQPSLITGPVSVHFVPLKMVAEPDCAPTSTQNDVVAHDSGPESWAWSMTTGGCQDRLPADPPLPTENSAVPGADTRPALFTA
jgi:hypothetical protein